MQNDKKEMGNELDNKEKDISKTKTNINIMENIHTAVKDNTSNIDDEVVNSIQKLVEEETNVARAAFENQVPEKYPEENHNLDMKQTQVIPDVSNQLSSHQNGTQRNHTVQQKEDVQANQELTPQKKKLSKKNKIIIAVSAGTVLLLVIGIIFIVINNNKKSYTYNHDKGMSAYNSRNYSEAFGYLKKAATAEEGKNNADLHFTIYLCLKNTNQDEQALSTLKDILLFDKNNQKVLQELAAIYEQKKDGTALNDLIQTYKGTTAEQYLSDYIVNNPAPSIEEGLYNENLMLQFVMDKDCDVYYTLDSSKPDINSTHYEEAIELKAGTTTIKAVSVNEIGVYSEIVEFKYEIDYKKPDPPSVSPASGTYEIGQMITVDNIPEGSKIYYTTDGSNPSENSKEYTESIEMPQGNTIFSMIIIDQYNQTSTVTKRNYVVNKANATKITYDEALAMLKTQLQSRGDLMQDGNTTSTGGIVTFYNENQMTVQGQEIYYIRCDVRTSGAVSTLGYYGVGVLDGVCYAVVSGNGIYTLSRL